MHIDENTKLPLFAVIAAVPFLAWVVLWAGMVNDKVNAADAKIERNSMVIERNLETFKQYSKEQLGISLEIRDRVIRIEERVKQGEK